MNYVKYLGILLLTGLATACVETKSSRYQDMSGLELPPEMEIVTPPKALVKDTKVIDKGLGTQVLLTGSTTQPIIKIKKNFERSWGILEQALKLNAIEVTDKNREKGVLYVLFDPDEKTSGDSELFSNLTFFLFKDEYAQAAYKLTAAWRDSDTEVLVELMDQVKNDMLTDDEDTGDFEDTVDNGAKLMNVLFKTIRDDLPRD